ncbi:MAG: hypothetical protein JOY77_02385 [Alphaproteobacteria bacterium]|nr:hypothetical protein [Alphaproteobacteria bacterium]
MTRRAVLAALVAFICTPRPGRTSPELPMQVAGIPLPRSVLALKAAQFAKENYPPFLFNHCMRTYLFGAVAMQHHQGTYDADNAFAAASLHDLGLLRTFATQQGSFETDGADRAARFASDTGASLHDSREIWLAVALHDARFAVLEHQSAAAMLVALGAGSDVLGPDADMIDARRSAEIVAAFPRLAFKKNFTALLVDHCRRKPLSQRSTWLEGLCRDTSPSAWTAKLADAIAAAPFAE